MELVELFVNLIVVYHKVRTGKIRVLADLSEEGDSDEYRSTSISSSGSGSASGSSAATSGATSSAGDRTRSKSPGKTSKVAPA